ALGMSEGAAGRRVAAARICRRFPEAFALVARGDLHLSALCALAPHLATENASELFEACLHRTRQQVDELLAARFPKPNVREQAPITDVIDKPAAIASTGERQTRRAAGQPKPGAEGWDGVKRDR
ncbi:MAG TPA: hypothetical protein VIK01_26370, partial [Polyangiaceae bacterium]